MTQFEIKLELPEALALVLEVFSQFIARLQRRGGILLKNTSTTKRCKRG